MSYLERIEMYMEMGLNEDDAGREAYRDTHPEDYDSEDYE